MKKLVKTSFNVDAAKTFTESARFNDAYFIFASKPGPELSVVPTPEDSKANEQELFDSMLFGRRVSFDDIQLCANRFNWNFGEIYEMYDDQTDLSDKKFYVVVEEGVDLRVYKCLNNNDGSPSLTQPSGTSDEPFQTMEDGYTWKYMFTVDSFYVSRFSNSEKIPVLEEAGIVTSATPGAIDIIKIESKGSFYNNYTIGTFQTEENLRFGGNALAYALDGSASNVDGFYTNCLIRINSTAFTNGQFRLITDYRISGGKKLITIDEPFDFTPLATDQYEIYPNVFVSDTGSTSTEPCVARALINPEQANSISSIEILRPGRDYRSAEVELRINNSVPVLESAELRAIIGPSGGHGSDPVNELNAYFVGISTVFSGNSTPLIANNVMQSIGIVKNPLYADCEMILDTATVNGNFIPGEKIYRYRPIKLSGTVDAYANGTVIGSNSEFTSALRNNDGILLLGDGVQVFTRVTLISDTELKVNPLPELDATDIEIFLTPSEYFAECTAFDGEVLYLANVRPVGFNVSKSVYGELSQAFAKTSTANNYLTVGGRQIADFDSFNQIIRLEGVKSTDENFEQNEQIIETVGGITAKAIVHSFERGQNSQLDNLYVTGEINRISNSGVITTSRTNTSQATFEISNKYNGELVKDSGDILYVENIFPIPRKNDQVEIIKLYLEF